MNREQKAAVIDQIADELGSSGAIFALDYRGITVAQIAELREKLRPTDTKLRVAKNSLSERAADQAGVADIKPLLIGPTALALVKGDAAAAAKVLSDTARALRGPLAFKGGVMNGVSLSSAEVETIAKLPSRDVLNAQLVGTIAAPLTGLVRTLNALVQGLASQLGQIRDQGLVSGAAVPSASAEAPPSADGNESASGEPAAAAEEATEAAAEEAEAETEAATAATDESEPEAAAEPEAPEASEPEKPAEVEAEAAPSAEPGPETEPADAAEVSEADSPSAEAASDATAATTD
jgi:large subunit ribosomal protein L10